MRRRYAALLLPQSGELGKKLIDALQWALRYGKDAETIRKTAEEAGREIPKFAIAPEIEPGDAIIWSAFMALHTCRYIERGPIPWTEVMRFADRYRVGDADEFESLIRALDNYYLGWLDKQKPGWQ